MYFCVRAARVASERRGTAFPGPSRYWRIRVLTWGEMIFFKVDWIGPGWVR
jgi:hypothetical protein